MKDFELSLIGLRLEYSGIYERILGFFREEGVETPGASAEEFALVMLGDSPD